MAKSKYEYVRHFERETHILPETFIVVRIDGRGFHRFSKRYEFRKPNDERALGLMNSAAEAVFKNVADVVLGYGDSDEFSFVFDPATELFERRESKLVSTIVSTFTAHYVFAWPQFMPNNPLTPDQLPTFDGRAVVYPNFAVLRDYLNWRQVDCHINNLYNTTFWALIDKGGLSNRDAEEHLRGTVSADKNEILFSKFGINYNDEPEQYKKGSILIWDAPTVVADSRMTRRQLERLRHKRAKAKVVILHVDIIKDEFWSKHQIFSTQCACGPPCSP